MLNPISASRSSAEAPLLQAIGITKLYGTFAANDQIDLDLYPREIHALLGENGAGKSTLVKIMYGLAPAERRRDCAGRASRSNRPARRTRAQLGIGMVFQHFSLFDELTVAENIALGLDGQETLRRRSSARLAQVSQDYGLPLDPNARGLAALGRRAPAHRDRALPAAEAEAHHPRRADLGADAAGGRPALRRCSSGCAAKAAPCSTSRHQLDEVKRLCDRATILRGGKKVADLRPAPGDRGVAGAHDGRRRGRRGEGGDGARHHRAARWSIKRPVADAGRSASAFACRTSRSRSRAARSSASPASPATARTSCSRRCPASALAAPSATSSSTARPPG